VYDSSLRLKVILRPSLGQSKQKNEACLFWVKQAQWLNSECKKRLLNLAKLAQKLWQILQGCL